MAHDMLHVMCTQCVACDLHTIAPWPPEYMCWRKLTAQWKDCKTSWIAPFNAIIIIIIIISSRHHTHEDSESAKINTLQMANDWSPADMGSCRKANWHSLLDYKTIRLEIEMDVFLEIEMDVLSYAQLGDGYCFPCFWINRDLTPKNMTIAQ